MKKQHLIVAETFYSIQGEGPTAGVPAIFLRLGGCNLLCGRNPDDSPANGATWECDTIDVWRKGKRIEINALFEQMQKEHQLILRLTRGAHLVITGGEPLLQQEALLEFLILIHNQMTCNNWPYIEVETNGTVMPTIGVATWVSQWNVSPKLSNSGQPKEKRINADALRAFSKIAKEEPVGEFGDVFFTPVWFKFVISHSRTCVEWQEIHDDFVLPFDIPFQKLVFMPAASSLDELRIALPEVVSLCKAHGIRFSSRAQIEIWNQTTGV